MYVLGVIYNDWILGSQRIKKNTIEFSEVVVTEQKVYTLLKYNGVPHNFMTLLPSHGIV